MTKILWHSNSPLVPTGYGQQTSLFAPRLNEHDDYEVAVSAFYGLQGAPITWNGVPILPGMGNDYGGDYLIDHAKHWFGKHPRDGIVLSLMDVWVLPADIGGRLNMVSWTPVDHEPVQNRVLSFFATGSIPMAMSRFGQDQLREHLVSDLEPLYCPHGIDTSKFKPYPREQARELMGLSEDAFLVGMVAANKGRPSRKSFQQAFEAFAIFKQKHPEAHLYLHTCADPNMAEGENLFGLLRALNIPASDVGWADQYRVNFAPYPPEAMALIYSGMDVLLNPAMGEGFGIPVLEAQACGVPVIVTDFSAMPEVGKVGWQVEYRRQWTGHGSWQAVPDVEDIAVSLEQCYNLAPNVRKVLAKQAREHALDYSVDVVFEKYMLPALREAERRFEDRKPVELAQPLKVAA